MLFAILGSIIAGSAVITAASLSTKERPAQPMTIHNHNKINNNINNSINNSFNNRMTKTTKTATSSNSNVKDNHTKTTHQHKAEIDHDAIIDELYARYKLDKNANDLNDLLDRINKLR